MRLKNRLKELRARDGLNQSELAKLAGVSRQSISLLERGEYTPSVIIAITIAQVFKEPVENVFSLVEDEEWLWKSNHKKDLHVTVFGEMSESSQFSA